jgi:hypothetical protein
MPVGRVYQFNYYRFRHGLYRTPMTWTPDWPSMMTMPIIPMPVVAIIIRMGIMMVMMPMVIMTVRMMQRRPG